jgi:3-oxoacyl-[acyl-carrier-protein] synthase-3
MIILGTLSPDYDFPGTSCFLQAKLGVPGIAILDIRQQCSAFLYGMSIADQFLRTGMYRNILVVGAEVHSKGIDRSTKGREVAVLFGDGAGAIVMTRRESQTSKPDRNASQVYTTKLHGDGSFAKELWMPGPMNAGGVEFRITHEMIERGDHFPKMNGKVVFLNAVKRMSEVLIEALDSSGYKLEDVDLFLFHQANLRINEMVASQLKIPAEKVFNTIQKFGNTTAATIPLGMSEAVKIGRLKKGDLVASAAFGSGFTWASAIFRY